MTDSASPLSLDGRWEVISSSSQANGLTTYTFRGGTLTIDGPQQLDNAAGLSPLGASNAGWHFRVDDTKIPKRIVMERADQPGVKQTYAFEFRDRELWICRDFGDQPITPASFWPGSGGWVIGLRRAK